MRKLILLFVAMVLLLVAASPFARHAEASRFCNNKVCVGGMCTPQTDGPNTMCVEPLGFCAWQICGGGGPA